MATFKNISWIISTAAIIAFIGSIVNSLYPILANRFIEYGMWRLTAYIFLRNLNVLMVTMFITFLALHFIWFSLTKKIKVAPNNIISLFITLIVFLCTLLFTKDTLYGFVKNFLNLINKYLAGEIGFLNITSFLGDHFLTIIIFILGTTGFLFLIFLFYKIDWVTVINLSKVKCIKFAGYSVIALLLLFNIFVIVDNQRSPAGPNVILIVVDALRADSLGCYNGGDGVTPNMDAFSENAVLFQNAIAQSPWTANSSASIFTSVYPSNHNYSNYNRRVSDNFNTIAEYLKNQNYLTYGMSTNPHVTRRNGLAQGFNVFVEDTVWKDTDCSEVNSRFTKWLNENNHKKFFAMLWYIDPHTPYAPPAQYVDKYITDARDKQDVIEKAKTPLRIEEDQITEIDKDIAKKLYKGEVDFFDTEFENLINYLKNAGLIENSIIILTSDHGESFWEKDYLGENIQGHGKSLFEEEIKIPLIISLPNQREGKVISEKVQHLDLLPTILEYTSPKRKVSALTSIKGHGLRNVIEGKELNRKYFFSQCIDDRKEHPHNLMECIQTDKFKLIRTLEFRGNIYSPPDFQLFDLESGEIQCDTEKEEFKTVYDELQRQLFMFNDNLDDGIKESRVEMSGSSEQTTDEETQQESEKMRDRLRDLGYVQ